MMNHAEHFLDVFRHTWRTGIMKHYKGRHKIHEALSYALHGPGKNVRPLLAMKVAALYNSHIRASLPAACAVEMIHTYSLVHDDLPCMDDDDLRRGRPTVHKAFDEATALLVGDGLLTDAFRVLTDEEFFPDCIFVPAKDRAKQVALLSGGAGSFGMVLGQSLDLFWTRRDHPTYEELLEIHRKKTGELLGVACGLGAIAGGAPKEDVDRWREFGRLIGTAFQAVDDVLDDNPDTGKSVGKDQHQGKLTFKTFYSKERILGLARDITTEAIHLMPMPDHIGLGRFVQDLVLRSH